MGLCQVPTTTDAAIMEALSVDRVIRGTGIAGAPPAAHGSWSSCRNWALLVLLPRLEIIVA